MNPILEKRLYTVKQNTSIAAESFQLQLTPDDATTHSTFVAGQWVYMYLLNEDGSEWGRAALSIASAPSESKKQYELALKVYGDYTTRAKKLTVGSKVRIQGPFGVFTLKSGTAPLVMCAAGIGITPFRSMIREMLATHDPRPITLFYSNKTTDSAAYIEEFTQLAASHPQLNLVLIYTREEVAGSEHRRFDGMMLSAHVQNLAEAEYLVCGPQSFMDAVKEILIAQQIDPKLKLRKEAFQ